MLKNRLKPGFALIYLVIFGLVLSWLAASAAPEENLKARIQEKNEEIKKLEAEAQKYRETLEDIEKQADSLENRVRSLDRSVNRLTANIRVTNAKINVTALEIEELAEGIEEKESAIERNRSRIKELVAVLAENDRETPLEIVMKNDTISSFFAALDGIVSVQQEMQAVLKEQRDARDELKDRKESAEKKKHQLNNLVGNLGDQKNLQEYERRERSGLLAETKSQERRYQEMLAEVERKREALQQEINALESGLAETFDRSLLPKVGSGILGWPLPDPIFVTQYFGNTAFARRGAYRGKGHNGVDLRASLGTPVFAAEQGIVRGTGDTDLSCRRAAYGRWILIDHTNNLSTLYAHLSLVKVKSGETVNRGSLIGYSGKTGYATGPHLHFTVFAKQAVEIGQLKSRVCGRNMTLPLSPFGGYLNPLDYL